MTVLSIRNFTGEIPRLPADRLPDGAAQFAQNCDFTHGELRPLAGLGPHYETGAGARPCRGLFTPDGQKFFAWDKPTRAFLAPTIDDVWGRIYYNTEGNGLRVSQRAALYDKSAQPRPPATNSSWRVGVTRPNGLTAATSTDLALDVYVQTLKYGVLVEEVPVTSTTTVTPGVVYDVTVPPGALTVSTPTGVVTKSARKEIVSLSTVSAWGGLVNGLSTWEFDSEPGVSGEYDTSYYTGDAPLTVTGDRRIGTSIKSVTETLSSEQWAVARHPATGTYYAYRIGEIIDPESGTCGLVATIRGARGLVYKGTTYDTPEALYTAIEGAVPDAETSNGVTVRFRVKVYNAATSVVYYDGLCSHVATGTPLLYTITIPSFSTLLTSSGSNAPTLQTVAYVAVAVNIWGEESAPSDPLTVEFRPGLTGVALEISHTPNPAEVPLSGMLFYRTYPSNSGTTSYFLVNETPVVGVDGVYSLADSSTEPVTATTLAVNQAEWDPPPEALEGLSYAGNGVFCGAVGKDLYFSEPYKPHAWPYRMVFPHEIVGVLGIEGGILVTTTLHPYLVYGAHPEQMSQVRMAAEQSGWSNTALSHLEGSAVYAGNDGLVSVSGGQATIKGSQELFRREDWRKMFGAVKQNLRLAQHDGRLLGIIDPGT